MFKNLDRSFFHFVRDHACDGRTDGQTEFSLLYRVCITCSAVKMHHFQWKNFYGGAQPHCQTLPPLGGQPSPATAAIAGPRRSRITAVLAKYAVCDRRPTWPGVAHGTRVTAFYEIRRSEHVISCGTNYKQNDIAYRELLNQKTSSSLA